MTIEEGFIHFSQAFSIRDVKGALISISLAWQAARSINTPTKLAEELGSLVLNQAYSPSLAA
jgi:hypothetical protein